MKFPNGEVGMGHFQMLLNSASTVVRRLPSCVVFLASAAEEIDEQEACFIFHDAGGYFAAVVQVG